MLLAILMYVCMYIYACISFVSFPAASGYSYNQLHLVKVMSLSDGLHAGLVLILVFHDNIRLFHHHDIHVIEVLVHFIVTVVVSMLRFQMRPCLGNGGLSSAAWSVVIAVAFIAVSAAHARIASKLFVVSAAATAEPVNFFNGNAASMPMITAAQNEVTSGTRPMRTEHAADQMAVDADPLMILVGSPNTSKQHDEYPNGKRQHLADQGTEEKADGINECHQLVHAHEQVVKERRACPGWIEWACQIVKDRSQEVRQEERRDFDDEDSQDGKEGYEDADEDVDGRASQAHVRRLWGCGNRCAVSILSAASMIQSDRHTRCGDHGFGLLLPLLLLAFLFLLLVLLVDGPPRISGNQEAGVDAHVRILGMQRRDPRDVVAGSSRIVRRMVFQMRTDDVASILLGYLGLALRFEVTRRLVKNWWGSHGDVG
mmetsp:Transcript_5257/g.15363  ORF Transcript_5257/g.15363 Transcript_5257/m.15363 type:complete len:428 (-) Transcript_5257:184-1467(-)